mmetsp:Transcript_12310/g.49582  ORF Transcript_12310/g.49582 Transcript_12310/m.49582 type:complete len:405 (+) Transcript_12310:372-1586(+)
MVKSAADRRPSMKRTLVKSTKKRAREAKWSDARVQKMVQRTPRRSSYRVAVDLVLPGLFALLDVLASRRRDVGIEQFVETDDRHARRDFFRHDGLRAHRRVVADFDIPKHRAARAEDDAVADLGMPVAALLARAAERDRVQDGAVGADFGGFADDDARRVVHEEAAAELGGGVDVDGPELRDAVLDGERDVLGRHGALGPEFRRDSLRLHGVKALEEHDGLHVRDRRRVSRHDRLDVSAEPRVALQVAQARLLELRARQHDPRRRSREARRDDFGDHFDEARRLEDLRPHRGPEQRRVLHRLGLGAEFSVDGLVALGDEPLRVRGCRRGPRDAVRQRRRRRRRLRRRDAREEPRTRAGRGCGRPQRPGRDGRRCATHRARREGGPPRDHRREGRHDPQLPRDPS